MLWEEHSWGLLVATGVSLVVFLFGLVVNFSSLAIQYTAASFMPDLLGELISNSSHTYFLPVSLSDWSNSVWGIIYICQFFWLVYAVSGICRQTALGPAYNNPKLLPVQVHLFFSLAILTQVGWLILMDRERLALALLVSLLAVVCCLLCLLEAYRALGAVLPMLQQEERHLDVWAVRLLAHNSIAFFLVWMTLHGVMTFTLTVTFGLSIERNLTPRTGSLVELSLAGVLVLVYVVCDIAVLDKHCRYVVLPYLGFVLFHTAQLNKTWPDRRSAIFLLLAIITAFTFLAVFLKAIVLLWRHLKGRKEQTTTVVSVSRPLTADLEEEETYLLHTK